MRVYKVNALIDQHGNVIFGQLLFLQGWTIIVCYLSKYVTPDLYKYKYRKFSWILIVMLL